MAFRDARLYVLRFGPHRGRTLGEIGATGEGLKYLDGIVDSDWLRRDSREAIKSYLASPAVRRELEAVLGD